MRRSSPPTPREAQIAASLAANEPFALRVGIAAQFWDAPMTGSGQYVRELWHALHALGGDTAYRLIGDIRHATEGVPTEKIAAGDVLAAPEGLLPTRWWRGPVRAVERRGAAVLAGNADLRKMWWEQAGLVNAARAAADASAPLDVLHYPYWAAPLLYHTLYGRTAGIWNDPVRGRTTRPALVVTVHDLIPLLLPAYAPALKHRLYFRLIAAATRRADLILADSECTRRDVLRLLKLPPERVVVVPLGVSTAMQPVTDPGVLADLRVRYGIGDGPILGYLGGMDVRKNLPTLIRAHAAALPRLNADGERWTLVIGGKAPGNDPSVFPDLRAVCRAAGLDYTEPGAAAGAYRPVRFIGAVAEADKPAFYSAVTLSVFPSLYEGFGLPPLEALACGAAVITADASSIPEVVGDAAVLVAPEGDAGWTEAIVRLATDASARATLQRRGPTQAALFTWAATARRTHEMYAMAECLRTRGDR